MQKGENARIENGIVNLKAVSSRFYDAASRKPLKLIGDGLRLHPQFLCDLTDAQLTRAGQGVKHS